MAPVKWYELGIDAHTDDGHIHIYPASDGSLWISAESNIGMRGASLAARDIPRLIATLYNIHRHLENPR